MRIEASHRGAGRPFERDRQLVLRCLPVGATIVSARATVEPISADEDGRFSESIDFVGSDGSWGAHKRRTGSAVEVDLRARRTLLGFDGVATGGNDKTLLVDLGGGFMPVDVHGGISDGSPFPLVNGPQALPGLSAAGLRISSSDATDRPDVAALQVASPPTNVTMSLEGGPTFWTHVGELVDEAETPDFALLLEEALERSPVEHGHHVVGFTVHSDTICRLDIHLAIDVLLEQAATPDGVDRVALPYGFGSTPDGGGALSLSVPAGQVVSSGATDGRVQGAFEPSRVVFGGTGSVEDDDAVVVDAGTSFAQPLTPTETTVASSIDLLLAAVTSTAEVSVDIVGDLDGRPGRVSVLERQATRTVTRDEAPDATWINVELPAEIELAADARHWIVVHALDGSASWSTASSPVSDTVSAEPSTGIRSTTDAGLSWRNGEAGAAHLRLRHTTPNFAMPLELRVRAGNEETTVDLERFGASGQIDFRLDAPDVADAINAAIDASSAGGPPTGEHIANGEFDDWYRVGTGVRHIGSIEPGGELTPRLVAFSPDGATVHVVSSNSDQTRLESFDTYCQTAGVGQQLPSGRPSAIVLDPTGRRALVASMSFGDESAVSSRLVLADLETGQVVGNSVELPGIVNVLEPVPDGSGIYLAVAELSGGSTIVRTSWEAVTEAVTSRDASALGDERTTLAGFAVAVGARADSTVYAVTAVDSVRGAITVLAPDLGSESVLLPTDVPTVDRPRDATFAAGGTRLVVVGESEVAIVDPDDLRARATLALPEAARRVAADPIEPAAYILTDEGLHRLDVSARTLLALPHRPIGPFDLAVSPVGNRAVVTHEGPRAAVLQLGEDVAADWELTAGRMLAACFGDPSQPVAVLGDVFDKESPIVAAAAISQVVAVEPAVEYRFAFEALAELPGATAEVIWRTEECGAARTDTIEVAALERRAARRRTALVAHERRLVAPADAVAAEVRFHTPERFMLLDHVELAAGTESVSNATIQSNDGVVAGWDPGGAGLVPVESTRTSTTLRNPSTAPASLVQHVTPRGSTFAVEAVARSLDDSAASIELDFRDDQGELVGEGVRLPVGPLDFDRVRAGGPVPPDAVGAVFSVVVAPGGSVAVEQVSVRFDEPTAIDIEFVSEAPGELLVSDVSVGFDNAPPRTPAPPADGPCAATPPGAEPGADPSSCHCPACGDRTPIRRPTLVRSPSGRPGTISACRTCGSPRLSIQGRSTADASVPVGGFRVAGVSRAGVSAPSRSVGSTLVVDDAVTSVGGIASSLASSLADIDIRSIVDLAQADAAHVATVRGISERQAVRFIVEARAIVRDHGRWSLVPAGLTT